MLLYDWVQEHPAITGWIFGTSVLLFLGSLLVLPLLVARMRSDYFVSRTPDEESWSARRPVLSAAVLLIKNGVGLVLLAMGLTMLVLPGQGILTILIGLTLLNFPGKRRLELRIVRQRHVHRAIDWIRRRAGRPALVLPEGADRDESA